MDSPFKVVGRVDNVSIKQYNVIQAFLRWILDKPLSYEVEVYLKLGKDFINEIAESCDGNIPRFYPTEPESGFTYTFNTGKAFREGDRLILEFTYEYGKFRLITIKPEIELLTYDIAP